MCQNIYGQRFGPLGFISPKGNLNRIDIEIRTVYGQKSSPLRFISQKGILNPIDIEIGTIYGLFYKEENLKVFRARHRGYW